MRDKIGANTMALLGHSFGGKIALAVATQPIVGLQQVWVVDSNPGTSSRDSEAWQILVALRKHPGPFPTREAAMESFQPYGFRPVVTQWMMTNLRPKDDGFAWQFCIEEIGPLLDDFAVTDRWPTIEQAHTATPEFHLIRAQDSAVMTETMATRVEAAKQQGANVQLHRLAGGHWLHIDNPEGVTQLLVNTLP